MDTSQNLKKDFIWNLIGTTLNSFTSLFYMMIVARINGLGDSGTFSYAFSFGCLMFTVACYAGRIYQVTDNSEKYTDMDYVIQRIVFSILTMFISWIYSIIVGLDAYTLAVTLVLCLCKCIEACGDVLCGILQRNNHLYQAGISLTIKFFLAVGLFIGFDLLTKNMLISSILMTLGWILVTIFYDIPKTRIYLKGQNADKGRVMDLTKKGFSSFGVMFMAAFLVNATKYMMYGRVSDTVQGIYGMIIMPATMLTLCVQYILQPYLKALSEHYKNKDEKGFRKMVRLLVGATAAIGIVFLIGMVLLGTPVLSIIYATDLSGYLLPLSIIIFGAIFYSLSTVISAVLTALRILDEQLICSLIAGAAEIGIAILFIQKWMLTGAAMSYCLTMVILCLLYGALYIRKSHSKFVA